MTEFLGSYWDADWQSLHSATANGTAYNNDCSPSLSDASQNWHTYDLIWKSGSLVWEIDGKTTCTMTSNVPKTPMFIIMDIAVGSTSSPSTLPQNMLVDYARVYQ